MNRSTWFAYQGPDAGPRLELDEWCTWRELVDRGSRNLELDELEHGVGVSVLEAPAEICHRLERRLPDGWIECGCGALYLVGGRCQPCRKKGERATGGARAGGSASREGRVFDGGDGPDTSSGLYAPKPPPQTPVRPIRPDAGVLGRERPVNGP